MAGTDHRQPALEGGPAIILVQPQLGENIGMAARAMCNFGLTDLRLVNPREDWPNEKANAASSGALDIIGDAKLFDTVQDAIADLNFVVATTARQRGMAKPVVTPAGFAKDAHQRAAQNQKVGVLFGREKSGLDNDDVSAADAILSIPVNPAFASLNLAQAVLLIGYEWLQKQDHTPDYEFEPTGTFPAKREDLLRFFEHLEGELDSHGFLKPLDKRPNMVRNLRNMFHRAQLTDQDVRTLRGVVKSLTDFPRSEEER